MKEKLKVVLVLLFALLIILFILFLISYNIDKSIENVANISTSNEKR